MREVRTISDISEEYTKRYLEFSIKLIEETGKRLSEHGSQVLEYVDRVIASADVASKILSKTALEKGNQEPNRVNC